jgi:hypothetical protein
MTVNEIMRALTDELLDGDVPNPLGQEFTLALIWCDLARLAGEVPPADVLRAADDSSFLPIPPLLPSVLDTRAFLPAD